MAFAYTPGLRVAANTVVFKERRLPLAGKTLVEAGDPVIAETIVAKTELPGNVKMLNIANVMGLPPGDIPELLFVKEGEEIDENQPLGETKGFFGLFKNTVRSPIHGVFESYNKITGQAVLREPPIPVEIDAYLKGTVTEILENEGVIVESNATYVQGIFGIGGETRGELKVITDGPDEELAEELIDESCRGKVLLGGSFVSYKTLNKAIKTGVKAVIVGGFDDKDLKEFLGYDLGVAITGHEKKGITLILTEGFGRMTMAHGTFNLLRTREGMLASVNGATQIRAGVMRPEVVIPLEKAEIEKDSEKQAGAMDIGSPIRCIRAPYFGKLGTVEALPAELQVLDSEAKVRVLDVKFENGEIATVPRANVELIEE
ncbi:MAG: hypothetical protein K8S15_14455 [Candidatus Aegiribacteria sp.]|nr:hypothetical protein [Candidatus Aegiribacteria sp.]